MNRPTVHGQMVENTGCFDEGVVLPPYPRCLVSSGSVFRSDVMLASIEIYIAWN